ncbi:MAG TPA: hemerythrin domain-containing protein [Anaeromyxobacter sp.]
MNAIDLLKKQHREVEGLFEKFEGAGDGARKTKERLCREIADQLAVHAEIEEKIFYPESKQESTEDILRESVEEHLAIKRTLADLIESAVEDPQFDARVKVLRELVEHHVGEEEKDLFPKVKKACSKEELEDMGARMEKLAEELELQGEPSKNIPSQTDEPAPI